MSKSQQFYQDYSLQQLYPQHPFQTSSQYNNLTQEKLRELQMEEYFIQKLKKQKEKVQILKIEFTQQQALLEKQQQELAQYKDQNNKLKKQLETLNNTVHNLQMQLMERDRHIYQLQKKHERTVSQYRKLRQIHESCRETIRYSQLKLVQQQALFSKNFESLRTETRGIEKQTHLLKQKFKQKTLQTNQLCKNLQIAQKTIQKLQQNLQRHQVDYQNTLNDYELKLQNLQTQSFSHQKQIQSHKNKILSQLKLIGEYQTQEAQFNSKIDHLQNTLESFQNKNRKLEQDLRICLGQIRALQGDVQKREDVIKQLGLRRKNNKKYDSMKKELMQIRQKQADQIDFMIEQLKVRKRPIN